MRQTTLLLLILLIPLISCNKEKRTVFETSNDKSNQDTTKLYRKIKIIYGEEKKNSEEYEGYVSKEKDTFWNQWKFFKNSVIDSSKSKFYDLKITGNKNDSILKGKISFFSPADSIPKSNVSSRDVTFIYLQRESDSIIIKEIKTDKNIIYFDYKNFDEMTFVGYISDLRFFEFDSLPKDELLLNTNYFAIDTETSTNNNFIELLK